ncbi:GNAT family N-acetyltransferase [Haloactinomyces albus]|uniref:Phosphinothricin acetyltransferase n=1 Tax=Haloactinomyces albus TaxID=1352928 RepID=A0AAE3ZCC1_9ACTN|nr:N-acetyltransferase family protein [Haloactinomyces albus]MDR7302297.1 phosphinothricin acetyltransferase [Haloactinomyces albus]
MNIRPAHVTDAASIESIYGHYVRHSVLAVDVDNPPTARDWEQRLDHLAASGYPTLVAVDDRAVVGYALLTPWLAKPAFTHTAENSIYLAPYAVGAGLGRQLLARLLDDARGCSIREVIALVADGDHEGRPSRALHLRAGFQPAGRLQRVGRKQGRFTDVDFLQLSLQPKEN